MSAHSNPARITIRLAHPEDISSIVAADIAASELFRPTGLLVGAALDDHVEPGDVADAIRNERIYVSDVRGRGVVGFSLVSVQDNNLYLEQISVDPAFGRQGIGRLLMVSVEAGAKAINMHSVLLSTFRDLPWNAPFYASLGYQIIDRGDYTAFMHRVEADQAPLMDITKRVFMRKRVRKAGKSR